MAQSPEERAAYQREYRKSNREKLRCQARERYQRNKHKILAKNAAYREKNLEAVQDQVRNFKNVNPEAYMLRNVRSRAKKRGIEFSITVQDITIPELCPYLNIPLFWGTGGHEPNSPSLDRIDNSKGYVPGNVRVISNMANGMKRNATPETLLAFRDGITRLHG